MQRKTIIIFITVFILIGGAMFGFYYSKNKASIATDGEVDKSGYNTFNPFENTNDTGTDTESENTDVPTEDIPRGELVPEPIANQKLHKIADFAVAGATYFDDTRVIPEPVVASEVKEADPTTTPIVKKEIKAPKPPAPKFEIVPSIRYVERATGHIYQMYLDTKVSGKVSNSTIPSIHEVIFDGSAKSVIYRYLSTDNNSISSFVASLGSTKSEFLPSNVIDITLSGDKTKYFYLTKSGSGVTGTIRSFNETKTSQVFTSPYTEWISQWVGKDKIFLTTKASSSVDGSIFSLNTTTGTLSKVFGGVKGLTTLVNNDGSLVLYSSSSSGTPTLNIFNIKDRSVTDLGIYSLAEKCIWSTDNITIYCAVPGNINSNQPDSWYQGLSSFDDSFIKINTRTGEELNIESSNNESIDATELFLDKKEETLFFTNKKDSTFWSLDLK